MHRAWTESARTPGGLARPTVELLEERRLLSAAPIPQRAPNLHRSPDRSVADTAVHAHPNHLINAPHIVRRAINAAQYGSPVSLSVGMASYGGPGAKWPTVASSPQASAPGSSSPTPPTIAGNWSLAFDDEFNGDTLASVWTPHQYWSDGPTAGEGVEESDPANVSISDGALQLTAKQDNAFGTGYTGSLVQAGGVEGDSSVPTESFLYGYAEARIKIPPGQGLWPAFWLMPASFHDSHGEIDIMEMLDGDPSTVYGTVHRSGAQEQHIFHSGEDLSAGWHTFAVDWEPNSITWYVDGVAYGTVTDKSMIPNEPMYPIFDLAVGGSWGGMPNASTQFPATMEVDYVRIWTQST